MPADSHGYLNPVSNTDGLDLTNRDIPGVLIFILVTFIPSTFVVVARLYTRCWIKAIAGWDDIFIVPGQICAIGWAIPTLCQVYIGGMGRHCNTISQSEQIVQYKGNIAGNLTLTMSLFCTRVSICIFLLRVGGGVKKWAYAIYFALALNFAFWVATMVTYSVQCVPLSRCWNTEEPGFALNERTLVYIVKAFGAINCIVDFLCAGIPCLIVHNLQMSDRSKAGTYLVLCCGLLTAACSIGRAAALKTNSKDRNWDQAPLTFWTGAELIGATTFASVPALRQFYQHYREHSTLMRVSYGSEMSRSWSRSLRSSLSGRLSSWRSKSISTVNTREIGNARANESHLELPDRPRTMQQESMIGLNRSYRQEWV